MADLIDYSQREQEPLEADGGRGRP